jgi:hypothetical protein
MAPVSVSLIKQIAGRAGRRSSQYAEGAVTCRDASDLARLAEALNVPTGDMVAERAGLFPEFEHLEVFAGARPDSTFR